MIAFKKKQTKYGRLTIITDAGTKKIGRHTRHLVLCQCDCGNKKVVYLEHLHDGMTRSCGCLKGQRSWGNSGGESLNKTREYRIWCKMKGRCLNPKNPKYHRYGGRGIKICDRWMTYSNFIADMGKCSDPTWSLDRVDNNGDYCPENCRWTDAKTQARNSSNNLMLTYKGKTQCLEAWVEELGIPQSTLSRRVALYGVERAFTQKYTPHKTHNHGKMFKYKGKSMTLKQWAEELGLNFKALWARIHVSGMSFEKAIVYSRPKAKKK